MLPSPSRLLSLLGILAAVGLTGLPATADTYHIVAGKTFRYGNWGGGDYSNGKPYGNPRVCTQAWVDDLDKAFMVHDQAYASADDTYGPKRIQAVRGARGDKKALSVRDVEKLWSKAYTDADRALIAAINALAPLATKRDGTDTWNGWRGSAKSKPSTAEREKAARYAKWAALLGLLKDPPYAKYGG